jgi:phage FluMu gp28-like protein
MVMEKCRQIGISYCEALWTIRKRLNKKINHYFVSNSEKTAKQFISDCLFFIDLLCLKDLCEVTSDTITMPNGSQIVAVSSNPNALRSRRGDVSLDEFAYAERQQDLLAAAYPVITWGGQLRIISTHNGVGTLFYGIIQDAYKQRNAFEPHRVDIYQAVEQGLASLIGKETKNKKYITNPQSFITDIKKNVGNDFIWEQEYECKVQAGGTSIVPLELYHEIETDTPIPDMLDYGKKYNELYIGIDPGRNQAYSVVLAIAKDEQDIFIPVCIHEMTHAPMPVQMDIARRICGHPSVQKVFVDMGSVGRSISDDLVMEYGNLVEPVAITADEKMTLCEKVRKFCQLKRIKLPANRQIMEDITSMRLIYTDRGNPRYEGGTKGGGHADYFMALALSLMAVEAEAEQFIWAMA